MLRITFIAAYPASELLPERDVKPAYRQTEHAAPWLRALCHGLAQRKDLKVCVLAYSRAVRRVATASLQGVDCVFVPKHEPIRSDPFHGYWPMHLALKPHLRAFQPDLVHGFGFEQGAGLCASRFGIASSVFIQGIFSLYRPYLDGHRQAYALHERLERHALRKLHGAVAETNFAAAWARQVNPAALLHIIPHGANPEFFAAQPVFDSPSFMVIGSLDRRKAPEISIRALAACRHPEARLLVAGDGAVRPVLQRLAAELGIARRVDFLGHIGRPELLRRLERVRAVIVMSRMDTSPNVVTEAHAAGLPVLGTRAGGISEMVEEGRDGFLVKVDDVTALAGHMDRLLEDAPLCARLGENGRAKVRELNDSARIAEAHASFFHALKARFDGLS